MRAQFVRGADPKDTMNIGNKHAREGQKMIAAFKEIDPNLNPRITDEQVTDRAEAVVVSVFLGKKTYSITWIKSGLEYYMASQGGSDIKESTFLKLEQAKEEIKIYLK